VKIKKYTASTEQQAIEMVKDELGLDALVLNIKKIQPKGFTALFRKATVEVTAAYEEKTKQLKKESAPLPVLNGKASANGKNVLSGIAQQNANPPEVNEAVLLDLKADGGGTKSNERQKLASAQMRINMLEQELDSKESLLEKAASLLAASAYKAAPENRKYSNNMLQIFYDALINQGVTGEIAEFLLNDVSRLADDTDLEVIVRVVYNNILNIFGETPEAKAPGKGVYLFLGPTGVGKTTTIAKLSSKFVLAEGKKVGLLTADTYRIAAVEQLKTYAEILGIDIGIIYNAADLRELLPKMKNFSDLVLVDTAGRSHRNENAVGELNELLSAVPEARRFLVLSLTTKYDDLISIVNAYSELSDFDLIFTKADETLYLGSMLNICYITGKKISYITNGQNVPDDIMAVKPEQIAKSLLGLGGAL
jgi:flagellar biosynthesis protein FlhF